MSNDTGDRTWGHLSDTEHFGRKSQSSDYIAIDLEEITRKTELNCTQAAHCMIYSKQKEKIFGIYDPRAAVLMQLRFDGYLGFPGGLISKGENIVSGLNRELLEEINLDIGKMPVKQDDYIVSHWNERDKLLLHMYAIKVSLDDFKLIEKNSLLAEDYGTEVMGIVRVPLFTMGDGYRGFPAFLTNAFAGNSRTQLLHALVQREIMSKEEIDLASQAKPI